MILHIAMFMPRGFYLYRMMQLSKVWYTAATDRLLWYMMFARRWPRSIVKEFSPSALGKLDPHSAWRLLTTKYCFQEYSGTVPGKPVACEISKFGFHHPFLSDRLYTCTIADFESRSIILRTILFNFEFAVVIMTSKHTRCLCQHSCMME